MSTNGTPLPLRQLRYFWLSLLARTFEEAEGRYSYGVNVKEEAREWLLTNEVEFEVVCELAGLDGKVVRAEARRRWQT